MTLGTLLDTVDEEHHQAQHLPDMKGKPLSATEFERRKTPAERAEDIAYTINHSLYCTLTDFINPPINAATDGWLRWLIPGCGHDHSKDGGHGHVHTAACGHSHGAYSPSCGHVHMTAPDAGVTIDAGHTSFTVLDNHHDHVHGPNCNHGHHHDHHHDHPHVPVAVGEHGHSHTMRCGPVSCTADSGSHIHTFACGQTHAFSAGGKPLSRWERVKLATKHAFSGERFMQYAKGEFIGDFGAVPLTIGLQRAFPGFMDGLRKVSEPVMGPVFKWGIELDSKGWAKKNGIDIESKEYKDHVKDVYEHEMRHFPQAIAWTGFSLGLNVAYQMHADKTVMPTPQKLLLKTTSCLSGIVVTAGMVVAARALAPHRMRGFDQWTSKNVILPTTRGVGGLFGVDNDAVNRMIEKHDKLDHATWAERLASEQLAQAKIPQGAGLSVAPTP